MEDLEKIELAARRTASRIKNSRFHSADKRIADAFEAFAQELIKMLREDHAHR